MSDMDSDNTTAEIGICVTCRRRGGLCRWSDDAEVCMRKQLVDARDLLCRLNAEIDTYWNSDRSDGQVKRISAVQQECKQHVGGPDWPAKEE